MSPTSMITASLLTFVVLPRLVEVLFLMAFVCLFISVISGELLHSRHETFSSEWLESRR